MQNDVEVGEGGHSARELHPTAAFLDHATHAAHGGSALALESVNGSTPSGIDLEFSFIPGTSHYQAEENYSLDSGVSAVRFSCSCSC